MVVFYADACCLAFGVAFRIFGGYLIKTPIDVLIVTEMSQKWYKIGFV